MRWSCKYCTDIHDYTVHVHTEYYFSVSWTSTIKTVGSTSCSPLYLNSFVELFPWRPCSIWCISIIYASRMLMAQCILTEEHTHTLTLWLTFKCGPDSFSWTTLVIPVRSALKLTFICLGVTSPTCSLWHRCVCDCLCFMCFMCVWKRQWPGWLEPHWNSMFSRCEQMVSVAIQQTLLFLHWRRH